MSRQLFKRESNKSVEITKRSVKEMTVEQQSLVLFGVGFFLFGCFWWGFCLFVFKQFKWSCIHLKDLMVIYETGAGGRTIFTSEDLA